MALIKGASQLSIRKRRYHDIYRPTSCLICDRPADGFHYNVFLMNYFANALIIRLRRAMAASHSSDAVLFPEKTLHVQ